MDYLKADYWYVREAAILLLGGKPINDDGFISSEGMRPLRPDEPDHLKDLCELTYRAMDAGALPFVGKRKNRKNAQVRPADFARWAAEKGYAVPDGWAHWLVDDSVLAAEQNVEVDDGAPASDQDAEADDSPSETEQDLEVGRKPAKCPKKFQPLFERIIAAMQAVDPNVGQLSMPGNKKDFHQFCMRLDGHLDIRPRFTRSLKTFHDHLKGWILFPANRETAKYYHDRFDQIAEAYREIAAKESP